jgi:hypothetical protein
LAAIGIADYASPLHEPIILKATSLRRMLQTQNLGELISPNGDLGQLKRCIAAADALGLAPYLGDNFRKLSAKLSVFDSTINLYFFR